MSRCGKQENGLRLLNQNPTECTLSFVLSSSNTITNIRKCIRALCAKYGTKVKVDGLVFHLFPKVSELIHATEDDFKGLKFGFRAKYFHGLVHSIKPQLFINSSEDTLRRNLTTLQGIGDKIADCIMCFSLGFDNIMPIDTWASKALTNYYNLKEGTNLNEIRKFVNEYFEGYGAWAGQFLFEYIRLKDGSH